MVEVWIIAGLVLLALLFGSGSGNSSGSGGSNKGNSGQYNRGVLQQASPETLREYVAKVWENRGYTTKTSRDDAEYADVVARSDEEVVAISVRRRQEEDRVSGNAVKRFVNSAEDIGSDRSIMVCTSYYTDNASNIAQKSDIELLNGEELADVFTECNEIPT